MEREIILEILLLSLSGTVLGLLVCLLRPLTGKLFSWKWHYYLWLLVLLRLAMPVHIDAGIFPSPAAWSPEQTQAVQTAQTDGTDNGGEETGREEGAGNAVTAGTEETAGAAGTESTGAAQSSLPSQAGTADSSAQTEDSAASVSLDGQSWTVFRWLLLIWLFGALLSLAVRISNYRNFVNYVKADCARVSDDRIQRLAGELAEKLHIRKWLWVYESPLVASPVLIGVRHPFIVLPKTELSLEEARLILQHEFIHLKRHDLWYKWLFQLILCAHWFNPVLLLFRKMMDRDCELSCDEAVIGSLTETERKRYGNILLDTAERQLKLHRSVLSATLMEGKENLKQRLQSILSFRKRGAAAASVSILIFAAAAALAACAPAGYRQTAERSQADSSAEGNASEEGKESSGGFLSQLIDGIGGGWKEELMNAPFDIDPAEDAWQVYDDETLLAGKDVDGIWRAYFYSGGDGRIQAESFAFCGSDSILIAWAEEPVDITVCSSWELLSGAFKLVHIGPDGTVNILTEEDGEKETSVTLEPGRNVIKMAGREAKLGKLDISFQGLNTGGFSAVYYTEEEEDAGRLAENIQNDAAGKEEFLSSLTWLDEDVINEAFQVLLDRGENFTGPELEEIFSYGDEKEAGELLVQAVKDGKHPAFSGETIVELLPYMEETAAVELVQEMDREDFTFHVLEELLYYLDDGDCETCVNHYLDLGNTLTGSQYEEIRYLLDDEAAQRLDRRLGARQSRDDS